MSCDVDEVTERFENEQAFPRAGSKTESSLERLLRRYIGLVTSGVSSAYNSAIGSRSRGGGKDSTNRKQFWSNTTGTSMSQLFLQPFFCFFYITGFSLMSPGELPVTLCSAESNGKLPHLFIPSTTATLVPEFAVEDLPLGRTAAMVPEFTVNDLPLGRTP